MSDDSVETPIEQTNVTGAHRRPSGPSPFPWILFGVTAGVLVAVAIVLMIQLSSERDHVDELVLTHEKDAAKVEEAQLAASGAKARVVPLEEQIKALTAERDQLAVKARALEEAKAGEPATAAEAPLKAPAPTKPPAKRVVKKTVAKKKRR